MKKRNVKFYAIVSNIAIIAMLVCLTLISVGNGSITVWSKVEQPYYQGDTDKSQVSLMFNVYWGNEYIDGILDTLDDYEVKATFFVGGMWVEKYGDILTKIIARGHEIGNHGYFHKDQKKLNYQENYDEINMTNKMIEKYGGVSPKLFAPPSGSFGDSTLNAAAELNMSVIMWSKDTIDWRDKNTDLILKRATNNVKNGDLILMHPTKNTLEALPGVLKFYREKGFNQVKVSDNIGRVIA